MKASEESSSIAGPPTTLAESITSKPSVKPKAVYSLRYNEKNQTYTKTLVGSQGCKAFLKELQRKKHKANQVLEKDQESSTFEIRYAAIDPVKVVSLSDIETSSAENASRYNLKKPSLTAPKGTAKGTRVGTKPDSQPMLKANFDRSDPLSMTHLTLQELFVQAQQHWRERHLKQKSGSQAQTSHQKSPGPRKLTKPSALVHTYAGTMASR